MEQIQLYLMADARNVKIVDADLNASNTLFTLFKCVPVEIYLHLFNLDGIAYTYDELNSRVWSFVIADDYNNKTAVQLRADKVEVLEDGIVKITISEMNTIELDTALGEEKAVRLGAELFGKLKGETNDNWVMQWNCSVRNRRDSAGEPTGVKSDYYTKSEVDSIISEISVDTSNFYTKAEIDDKLGSITIDTSDFYTKNEVDFALSAKADLAELDKYQLSADAFSGNYNDLTNKPENITTLGNNTNVANGLVLIGEDGKIPSNLYDGGSSYSAGSGISISNKSISLNLMNYITSVPITITCTQNINLTASYGFSLTCGNVLDITAGYINIGNSTGVSSVIRLRGELEYNGNAVNTAGGLVVVGSNGKIPSNLYDAGSSSGTEYTAGNGITITDNQISVKDSGYTVYTNTYRITETKEGETSNNTYHSGSILIGENVNNKGIEITWKESSKYNTDSYIFLRNATGITIGSKNGIRANNIYIDAKVYSGGTVSTSYVAKYENTGNIHTIALTAETACTLTTSSVPVYATLMVIVDNSAGGSLLFGDEEVISQTETGKYALVFSCLTATTVKLYNKIEV